VSRLSSELRSDGGAEPSEHLDTDDEHQLFRYERGRSEVSVAGANAATTIHTSHLTKLDTDKLVLVLGVETLVQIHRTFHFATQG